jgi:hypothetical protein
VRQTSASRDVRPARWLASKAQLYANLLGMYWELDEEKVANYEKKG